MIYNQEKRLLTDKDVSLFAEFERIENADLKRFSTMKTGGVARIILFPKNHLEVVKILKICNENNLLFFILGNGSNVLFDDDGFGGVIISLKHIDWFLVNPYSIEKKDRRELQKHIVKTKVANKKQKEKVVVWAGAGVNLFALNVKLSNSEVGGLEWSYGVPASLGGFVYMNGGCFGHEIGEFVEAVLVVNDGKLQKIEKKDLKFTYRSSNLSKFVILGVKLVLFYEEKEIIKQQMKFYYSKKREMQPTEFASLGSVFKVIKHRKNSTVIYPAKIIDNMGLKGVKIGGAEVSSKHAGFIVNTGNATSHDVMKLVSFLENNLQKVGVFAEREIIYLKNDVKE